MKSVMGHRFDRVPAPQIQRSVFDRSHGHKTSIYAGYLYPILWDFVFPGDTFRCNATIFARMLSPLQKPIMDNFFIDTQFFFVPMWQIWDNFFKFMGERYPNPSSSIDYTVPVWTAASFAQETLYAHLGIRPGITCSAGNLVPRAYNWVWNTWYRDENLQNSVVVDTDDGPDDSADYVLLQRGKRHDYFTSCQPSAQRGTAVTLPLGTAAPVLGIGKGNQTFGSGAVTTYESDGTTQAYTSSQLIDGTAAAEYVFLEQGGGTRGGTAGYPYIFADLTNATAATINTIRQAVAVQQFLERDARGGTRYPELVFSHFRVVTPDARVKRPEFLGGGSSRLNVTPVPMTAASSGSNYQAQLAAFATGSVPGHGFTHSFTEHGIVLGLVSVRADLNYQQGMPREFSYSTRYDFYSPEFAHLGEQAVLNKEIWMNNDSNDALTFGYQERFAELRYKRSAITGILNSDATSSLDLYHLAQDFASLPTLGTTFIKETPPISRVEAVTTQPDFILDAYFDYRCARPLPIYGVPGLTRF